MVTNVNSLSAGAGGPVDNSHPPKGAKLDNWDTKPEQERQLNSTAFDSWNLLKSLVPTLKLERNQSIPYQHAVLNNMFDENLLRKAHDGIRNGLSFSLKETNIYKVRVQTASDLGI
ncbi:hypothetical protein MJO28_007754 [Puccinia striiformis f. sp. tritici]|uniref:Uncharacterized protein n=1 Tax=Puccinia striiformis f. sp. tritici TaxID=168172 RepID=A0ACC0EG51_9BASI|nr:hypothetical protein Pst134EA_013863 [Puccinia striiformis f. sp. tritici]KAH9466010.1 hypothetical protein Pst134EA_013863 [Puccinia striiformis f. sp. tritici]KAI7952070.1 hypothetical protein MJO28_007754 [Puccinia striiformis f. sp. tritici]KAI7956287.1 hypothetical protein MJO29_007686 [Puccinia striiformis f. sp. tritici]KAI9604238.1 hypothetical protein H4Q26_003852 [Puccinia striiformis f. sp. tritici PST-130]